MNSTSKAENTSDLPSAQRVVGKVISRKMDKTVVVQVERKVKHPVYRKFVKRFSIMYVHDEMQQCAEGDIVAIQMCRPISRTKHWKLGKVIVSNIDRYENDEGLLACS